MKRFTIVILSFLLISSLAFAQSSKKFYKTGIKFAEIGKTEDAISNYTKSLELDPNFVKSYIARAEAYKKMGNANEALEDYERAGTIEPGEEDVHINAAQISLDLKKYKRAIKNADFAIREDKKSLVAFHIKIVSLHNLELLTEAIENCDKAIEIKKNHITFSDKAAVLFSMNNFSDAQNYYQLALSEDDKNLESIIGIANSYYYQNEFDKAINSVNLALKIDEKSKDALWIRSRSYSKKMDYMSSINDLSQIILLYPNAKYIKDVYYERALSYSAFNQHIPAVTDYTKVIEIDPDYYQAYFKRADAYVSMRNLDKAIIDYEKLEKLKLTEDAALVMLAEAKVKLFELKREDDKPVVVFTEPFINDNNKMHIIIGTDTQRFVGLVKDVSPIKSFTINGTEVIFDPTSKKNEFAMDVIITNNTEIKIVCSDVYDNINTIIFPIVFTEIGKPEIMLVQPMVSSDGQIYPEGDGNLYIEGSITDDSKIAKITIDGLNASYVPDNLNPSFNATISITNKSKIVIVVEDIYGNITQQSYIINREAGDIADNPMGKTWVVFIENSKYETFASLEGPGKDITMMKSAMTKYNINAIIHKRNMTKIQMERFFSIELRDQVINNNVNSIIVWYAGHGKFLNSTGYWVPVDGKTDDEFTYFNIQTLKASMNSYSKVVTHTLVITDACESGPSFYQAMRGDKDEVRDCSDWKATKFKSSQVFSSAGYELASDNSQFTKTFANSLIHNPNTCIPIGSIVKKVKSAVAQNKQQEPQFGKIDGMPDENGTFFFIRK